MRLWGVEIQLHKYLALIVDGRTLVIRFPLRPVTLVEALPASIG
jgi:hypothetical protein